MNEYSCAPPYCTGVFMEDFYMFMEEVNCGQIDEEMKSRTIRALEIAEDVHRFTEPKS